MNTADLEAEAEALRKRIDEATTFFERRIIARKLEDVERTILWCKNYREPFE